MKAVTKYITNDGREFDDPEAAINHEKAISGRKVYVFWLDGRALESDQVSISGSTLRTYLGAERSRYNIYVENTPVDKVVHDADAFMLPQRFYACPNGVWGG